MPASRSFPFHMPRLSLPGAGLLALVGLAAAQAWTLPASLQAQETDPYLWLEEVEGEQAMEWVLEQNAMSREYLQNLPGYKTLFDNTLEIYTSNERIAFPSIRGDAIYNFWTDGDHPRGIYRRTTWESYLSGDPDWEVVLAMDALVAEEETPWAFRGMSCLLPEERLCLVNLSPGGSDAVEVREFDLLTKRFVEGGFHVPVSKNTTAWIDENTILVSHNMEEARTTTSGYSGAARLWQRGTPLETAEVILEAGPSDMAIFLGTQETANGPVTVILRYITIFDFEYTVMRDGELVTVDVPSDAQMGMVGDQMVLQLTSDWTVEGRTWEAGSVVSADVERFLAGDVEIELVIRPDERSTINGFSATRDYLLVNQLTDVQGRLLRFQRGEDGWSSPAIDTPAMGSVGIAAASVHDNRFFFTYSSFIQPSTLYFADEDGGIAEVASLPDRGLRVEIDAIAYRPATGDER